MPVGSKTHTKPEIRLPKAQKGENLAQKAEFAWWPSVCQKAQEQLRNCGLDPLQKAQTKKRSRSKTLFRSKRTKGPGPPSGFKRKGSRKPFFAARSAKRIKGPGPPFGFQKHSPERQLTHKLARAPAALADPKP